jgi:hypothetical protein
MSDGPRPARLVLLDDTPGLPEAGGGRDAGRRPAAPWWRRLPSGLLLAAAVAVGTFLLLAVRNRYLFGTPIYEDGDFASTSILAERAQRLRLLVGNYSRLHFNHPGPALLYVEAAGKAVFHDALHLVPAPFNGILLGCFALNALLVGLTVRVIHRHQPSAAVAVAALAVVLAWTAVHVPLSSAWFPNLYFLPFLLLAVAGASVAGGRTADLPPFVLAGGLLVHGHAAFTMFVAAAAAVAAGGWAWSMRRRWRAELSARWPVVAGAGCLLALFAVPLVLEAVLHWPGQWSEYLRYARSRSGSLNPLRAALDYAGAYWSPSTAGGAQLALAGVGAAGLAALPANRSRRGWILRLLGAVVLLSLLFVVYAVRGVDHLDQTYIGIFYSAVPLTLLLAVVVAATGPLLDRFGRAADLALLVAAGAVLVVVATNGPGLASGYRGQPSTAGMVAAVRDAPARAGRPVALELTHGRWPQVIGFMLAAHRDGLRVCAVDPKWAHVFTSDYICSAEERAEGWPLLATLRRKGKPLPPNAVWAGEIVVLVSLDGDPGR